ncbi:hypothetical protein [Novosphingobium sp.]|uniref:hypothetical protein n=1 Tax=Novosphingobium sp. TaxID=1874826 RepID=UPI002FE19F80
MAEPKYEITNDWPIPISEREKRLGLAQSIYDNFKVGKRTAARMAIKQLGNWRNVDDDTTAIDYLRQRIVDKTIHSTPD